MLNRVQQILLPSLRSGLQPMTPHIVLRSPLLDTSCLTNRDLVVSGWGGGGGGGTAMLLRDNINVNKVDAS